MIKIIHDRPWVVDFLPCKPIAVIPIPKLLQLVLAVEIVRDLFHIRRREAERLGVSEAEDAVDFEIVERGENVFFRDAQHARQHGKVERRIRL